MRFRQPLQHIPRECDQRYRQINQVVRKFPYGHFLTVPVQDPPTEMTLQPPEIPSPTAINVFFIV